MAAMIPVPGAGVVTVEYDGQTPWGAATPYVTFKREPIFYGGKWGQVARITLNGQVSNFSYAFGGATTFTDGTPLDHTLEYPTGLKNLEKIRDDIIEVFSNSLRTFNFVDSWGNGMSFDNAVVESVDFPSSGYWGLLDYSIELKCYEIDYFMAQGVMDVIDEFQTNENENATVTVTHRISARGFDYTDANGDKQHGLANAIAWVDSRKGSDKISRAGLYKAWWGGTRSEGDPILDAIGSPPINLKLMDQNETINRLTGVYEVSESFLGYLDSYNNTSGGAAGRTYGRRFAVDINESLQADFNVVTISGEYKGGKDTSIAELREGFTSDNTSGDPTLPPAPEQMLFEKAKELSGFDGSLVDPGGLENRRKPCLYNVPIGFSLEENEAEKTLMVKATFDTNPLFKDHRYFFNHKIDVSMDDLTNVTKVSINGEVEVRGLYEEKQFYLKKFLDTLDVMDFLWGHANTEHGLIAKTCWLCENGTDENGDPVDYWIRADIGDDIIDAGFICADHPYGGIVDIFGTPERCHELNNSASSLTMTKNDVRGTLSLSATFSDEDTLEIAMENPDDGTCWQCFVPGAPGIADILLSTVIAADSTAAKALCPDPVNNTVQACPAGTIPMGKDYGRASFSVDVKSPIDYAKANASAQTKYNGHWAIQKFGMKTREQSEIKVDLQFREDAGVPVSLTEPTLRRQAKDIQTTLNSMLDQSNAAAVSPVYDVSENITHKETKGDKLTHSLSRSYEPEESNAICIDIDPIGDQKDCFMCLDSSGFLVNSDTLGSRVYAYPGSGSEQELCDKIGLDQGFDEGDLTPTGCVGCWACYAENGEWLDEVMGDGTWDEGVALSNCPSGTTYTIECELSVSIDCYECYGGIEYDEKTYGPFYTISEEQADDICLPYPDGDGFDTLSFPCAPPSLDCYQCYYFGHDLIPGGAHVVAMDDAEAYEECAGLTGWPDTTVTGMVDPNDPDLTISQPCTFASTSAEPGQQCWECWAFENAFMIWGPFYTEDTVEGDADALVVCNGYEDPTLIPGSPSTLTPCAGSGSPRISQGSSKKKENKDA